MTPWVRASLRDLVDERPDLLVIGGGITGAGIARDAALRGIRTALVEASDFGAGTSSRSSRLVHGGLRYLEQARFRLVRESLRERALLLTLAPHLVRPLPFVLPFYRGDRVPAWKARLGLSLYDLLAGRGNVRRHQSLGKRGLLEIEPLLRERGLTGGARYYDAQCDDARLTLAVARGAAAAGARLANYVRVTGLRHSGGRIAAVELRDELSGEQSELPVRVLVNATGPWCDTLRRLEDSAAIPLLHPTKGSHVAVPRARIGNRHAVLFTSPLDGRVLFVLPWGNWTYLGTTETEAGLTATPPQADQADTIYLLRSANALFPGAHLTAEDVAASWAGLRPLLAGAPGVPASGRSREYRIVSGPGGMLSVAGGKLTTFRSMAAVAVDRVARLLGLAPSRGRGQSAQVPLPGGEARVVEGFRAPGLELGLPEATVDHLVGHYGAEAAAVYTLCRQRPELKAPLHPEHPAIAAQVCFAVERELACTVEDFLERRTRMALETLDGAAAARAAVARLLTAERGLS